jgi:anaerobic selenocysteine-containing dehydrogenase
MAEVKKVMCFFCKSRCRWLMHSENGRLVKFEEDTDFPLSPIRGCVRILRGAKEFMEHPDRLNFPLKRVGGKGEGKWQRISWQQALDEVAARIGEIKEKHGAEAIAVTTGTGRSENFPLTRFVNLLGTPNVVGPTTICLMPSVVTSQAIFGWIARAFTMRKEVGDVGRQVKPLGCYLIIGIEPSQSMFHLWSTLRTQKKMGCKLIVIDSRRTETAALADLWLQPRPGTDVALMLAMINLIIEEGLYDKEFVDKWCYGFDQLKKRAREYPAEKAAEITWVSADKIREAARMFATNKPNAIHHGMGIEQQQNSIPAVHCRYILSAIMGGVDSEGGEYLPGPGRLRPLYGELSLDRVLSPEQKKKQLGTDRFRLTSWPGRDLIQENIKKVWGVECGDSGHCALAHAPTMYRAILTNKPYPVRGVISYPSNPMVTQANVKLVYKALKALDLYVVHDYWLTPSAELADYVFPIASWMERPMLWDHRSFDCVIWAGEQGLPNIMPGEYERGTEYDFYRGLGMRLGQEEYWPWENLEQVYDHRLKSIGLSFKEFMAQGGYYFPLNEYRKYEKMGFGTSTGKVELYSTIFEKLGYDPLPSYKEPFETPISKPELAKEYPLMLITGGRHEPLYHSEFRQIDSLRRRHPHPLLQINPETAAGLDIMDGDWVWVETVRGRIRMKCRHFSGIDPRVVHAEHGWWFPELPGEEPWLHGVWESNVNVLTEDDPNICCEYHGGWPLRTALCKVYKCKSY